MNGGQERFLLGVSKETNVSCEHDAEGIRDSQWEKLALAATPEWKEMQIFESWMPHPEQLDSSAHCWGRPGAERFLAVLEPGTVSGTLWTRISSQKLG